ASADYVAAHDSARALDARISLSLGLHLLRQIAHDLVFGPLLDLLERLPKDLHALAALLDADPESIPAVADRPGVPSADRSAELDVLVSAVGVFLAQLPLHARRREVRSDEAPIDGFLGRDDRHVGQPLHEDRVVRDEAVPLVEDRFEVIEPLQDLV